MADRKNSLVLAASGQDCSGKGTIWGKALGFTNQFYWQEKLATYVHAKTNNFETSASMSTIIFLLPPCFEAIHDQQSALGTYFYNK